MSERVYRLVMTDLAHTKERPRIGNGHGYTPKRTRDWEEYVGWKFVEAHGKVLLRNPLRVTLFFGGGEFNQDIDNLAKAMLDGLNGVAWVDDRQIVDLRITKEPKAALPETSILIEPLEGEYPLPAEGAAVARVRKARVRR